MKKKILFLCTGNSCRSQMGEGWAKALLCDSVNAYSAGTEPHGLNPFAVQAMQECDVDISDHSSKTLKDLEAISFDLIVTVCDSAASACPIPPPGTRVIHAPFDDPPQLAKNAKSDDEAMKHYRRVRDEIKDFVLRLPSLLEDR
ncbi:MAG: arsenate reductase ArsC [Bdellovibrionales bacterium]|nr:arsenate reductase ArsC [Bdellovibrionales bacterium]